LLHRILRRGLVGKTGFLIAPENDGALAGSLAARPDLERGRAAGAPSAGLEPSIDVDFLALLRWWLLGLLLLVSDIEGKVIQSWLPMSDRRLRRGLARGKWETGRPQRAILSERIASCQQKDRKTRSH
jgi:hypothetical protein